MRYSYGKMEAGWIPGHPLAFKKNAVGKIQLYDPVVNAIESVGNAVGDAVNWVVDEVIDPVVDTVGQVVQGMLDNPVKTIAQVAAIATQQYWALPLIEGADVAAKGGDLNDVLEATAKAYVAQELGSAAGKYAGAQTTAATGSQVAGRVVGSAAASTTAGLVYGKDPIEALKTGLITAGSAELVSATLGELDKQTGGNFAKLRAESPTAAAVIESSITAQITGQDVTAAAISSALRTSKIATDIVSEFNKDGALSPSQAALAAEVLTNVTATAFAGGNPNAALQATLMKAGSKALGDIAKKEFTDAINGVQKAYGTASKKADEIDANIIAQTTAADNYNKTVNDLNARVKEQDRLLKVANNASDNAKIWIEKYNKGEVNKTVAEDFVKTANDAVAAYNTYAEQLTTDYDKTFKPNIAKYEKELNTLQTNYDKLVKEYNTAQEGITTAVKPLDTKLEELYSSTSEAFVSVMDPDFKVKEYKEVNGLTNLSDADAYEHWLTDGQFKGLKTNAAAVAPEITVEKDRLLTDLAKAKGVSTSQLSAKDISNFYDRVDSKYGNNATAIKNASLQDLLTGGATIDSLLTNSNKDGYKVEINGVAYGDWLKPPEGSFTLPENMRYATAEEMENGTATLITSKTGLPVWLKSTEVSSWNPTQGDTVLAPVVVTATRLDDLQQDDPLAWFETAQSLPEEVARKSVGDYLYDFAKNTIELANKTNNSTIINGAANALKAGGGILEAFNGLVVLAGNNPKETAVGKFAESLTNLGKASNTEEYKAALADMQQNWQDARGITGTAKAIWKNFSDYPAEFLAEIVGVEGMQEIVPLLVGGGAATAARGLALAKGMGTTLATQIGTRTGLAAAGVSDIAESAGGAAANAFNDTYNTALKAGKSEAEATKIALDVASRTALVAGTTTAVTLGLGGAALEKVILGRNTTGELAGVIDEIGNRIKTGGKIVVKEGVTEGIEEGLQQGYLEGQLHQLDPTRDVAKNIATSSILGAIAGGGVAGGAYAGYSTGDTLSNILMSNGVVGQTLNSSTSAQDLTNKLNGLGLSDNIIQSNLLNTKYDTNYTSTAEAKNALVTRPDFVPTQDDINALVGSTSNTNLPSAVEAYVDPRVVDRQEIIDAAAKEGVVLTEEQINQYIGQKDEASTLQTARTEVDPFGTTFDEAKTFFTDVYGYTPTDAEIQQFVRDNFTEEAARPEIGTYVDPRQVTRAEAEQFFQELGYTPTEQEIQQFIRQGANIQQTGVQTELGEYVDPRMVTTEEVYEAFKNLGFEDLRPQDAATLIGQYEEKLLADRASGKLNQFQYNALQGNINDLKAKLGDPYRGVTQADVDFVGNLIEQQTTAPTTQLTPEQLAYDANQDGVIDQTDLSLLQGAVRGTLDQPFVPAAGTIWAQQPTGIYGALAQQSQEAQARDAAARAQATRLAQQTQQRGNVNTLMQMLAGAPDIAGQQVTVKAPDPARIGYVYDIGGSSIFATPQQEQMFISPYAQGGVVEDDVTTELLKILRS